MKYVAPMIRSITTEDIEKHLTASASCTGAYCPQGTTFTCGVAHNFEVNI